MAVQESKQIGKLIVNSHLVLAGGGHTHALVLRMWAMQPRRRPEGLITLVNRQSTALYSGMVPGLVAGLYNRQDLEINLRRLADQAAVAFVIAEITGLDPLKQQLLLAGRPPLSYDRLSLNLGSVTPEPKATSGKSNTLAIKPLEQALSALNQAETDSSTDHMQLVGSGLAAIELALALRHRWPKRTVQLQVKPGRISPVFQKALATSGVNFHQNTESTATAEGLTRLRLHCTGSKAPTLLAASGLPVDRRGRVCTAPTLEVLDFPMIFASGDCAVIDDAPRPASGVWAVRAATPLARNLEASCSEKPLKPWRPQRRALQLMGGFDVQGKPTAWALCGSLCFGPHPWLWHWKQWLDRRFMKRFQLQSMASDAASTNSSMLCRGCAAKVSAATLQGGLDGAGLKRLGTAPEDAAVVPSSQGEKAQTSLLQSVDGFPALISDPWLNGRITALHACSDLWACGTSVNSAQAVVTLPLAPSELQQQLLAQTLAGIRSVLDPQQAELIGGHTLEARESGPPPCSLGIQVVISAQGWPKTRIWPKQGIQGGDQLLLSRPLGTGVLFAAAMAGATKPADLDQALAQMQTSQHPLVDQLTALEAHHPGELHAVTDITGFGLLGHLGEMLGNLSEDKPKLQVQLEAQTIPALPGSLELFEAGYSSSLAPANRNAWALLDPQPQLSCPPAVILSLGPITKGSSQHLALLELLIDPQTCGPLLISVSKQLSKALLEQNHQGWWPIGQAVEN